MEGTFLVSFSKGYQGHTGSASCLSLWERWMRPTGADGEGAPRSLRGAAAAAAEGPSNRRNAKNAFSEAASIFPLRLLLWDYQGRAALDSWIQRVEIAGAFLVLFCAAKENKLRPAVSASKSPCPCRAEHTAFASQTGLRLKSPTGAFMPSGHRRPFWFSFGAKREHPLSKPLSPAAPPPPAGPARPAGRRPAAPRSHSIPPRCRAAHAEPARPQRPLPAP